MWHVDTEEALAPPSEDEREGKEAFISVLSTLHCCWFYADVRPMMTSSVDDTIAFITDTSRSTADTIATTEDSKETSSTSKSITAAATAAGAAGAAAPVPFYINTWFHISHSPMKPTAQQIQDYADFQSPDRKPVTSLHRAGLIAPCWSNCTMLVYTNGVTDPQAPSFSVLPGCVALR